MVVVTYYRCRTDIIPYSTFYCKLALLIVNLGYRIPTFTEPSAHTVSVVVWTLLQGSIYHWTISQHADFDRPSEHIYGCPLR